MKSFLNKFWEWSVTPYVFFGLTALSLGQTPTIPSAGAKIGWTYYAYLLPAANSRSGEDWKDLNFLIIGGNTNSKKPEKRMRLKCVETMRIRSGYLVEKQGGGYDWPPLVGVLAAGSVVTVLDVKVLQLNNDKHYWIMIQRD